MSDNVLLVEWSCCSFSVRLYQEGAEDQSYIIVSCSRTRLQQTDYGSVGEGRNQFQAITSLMRDVIACIQQDPTTVQVIDTVPTFCSLCNNECSAKTVHLHQCKLIGDECCWDERLRSTA